MAKGYHGRLSNARSFRLYVKRLPVARRQQAAVGWIASISPFSTGWVTMLGRNRTYLVNQAVAAFIGYYKRQVDDMAEAIASAEAGDFANLEAVPSLRIPLRY